MRTTKLDQEIIQNFCAAIGTGISREGCCNVAGISESTLYNWLARAKELEEQGENVVEEEQIYLEFMERMKLAEAELEQDLVEAVRRDGPEGAKWLLTKRFRAAYGNHFEVDFREKEQFQYEIIWPDQKIDQASEP